MEVPPNGWFLQGKILPKWTIWGYPSFSKPSYSKQNQFAEICALNFANGKDVGLELVHLALIAVALASEDSCPLRPFRVAEVDGCLSYLRHENHQFACVCVGN